MTPTRRCAAAVLLVIALALPELPGQPAANGQGGSPVLKTPYGDVPIFPPDNPWNQDVSRLPVHPLSADYVASIGAEKPLHPDFGTVWKGAPCGMLLADNGGDWYVSGAPHPKWDDEALATLKRVKGRDFEAVDTGKLVTE